MTGPWLVRRFAGDARRHVGVWVGLALAFALAAFCVAGARATARVARAARAGAAAEPAAHVIAYLDESLSPEAVGELQRVLARLPGVDGARLVSPGAALERLRAELGPRAGLVDGVGADLMFSSIEIAARPASAAAALAFRLRRVAGVADVDLVMPPSSPPSSALAALGTRLGLGFVAGLGGVVLLLILVVTAGALLRLRDRYRPELRVLATLGLSRSAGARPALALAMGASALGVVLGLGAALVGARVLLGASAPPAREWALGAAAFVVIAYGLSWGALRVRDVADAR